MKAFWLCWGAMMAALVLANFIFIFIGDIPIISAAAAAVSLMMVWLSWWNWRRL